MDRQLELEQQLSQIQLGFNIFSATSHQVQSPVRPSPMFKQPLSSPGDSPEPAPENLEFQLDAVNSHVSSRTIYNLEEQVKRLLHENYQLKVQGVTTDQELKRLRSEVTSLKKPQQISGHLVELKKIKQLLYDSLHKCISSVTHR